MNPSTLLIIAIAIIVLIGIILVRKVWMNEKNKAKWLNYIQIGDKCSYHFVAGTSSEEMWISKKLPDGKYEITFIGQERLMYPKTKK